MSQTDIDRFRRRCAQFRWLAVFMVVSVGALIALIHVISPLVLWSRGEPGHPQTFYRMMLMGLPAACYLFGVWSIGQAMGQLARGRLIQPILADALRRVGLALWIGGVLSVFVVTNVLRFVGLSTGGYLHFDVPGMTLGMIGAALFLLGRVADQAGRVQAELDEMI
ncbi:MAG: DUF2975 domain-containing protein [Caulobacteraceae bacterium]|nr:DUF2975 domain-containing protein [Caulobacteraceae bacterium]